MAGGGKTQGDLEQHSSKFIQMGLDSQELELSTQSSKYGQGKLLKVWTDEWPDTSSSDGWSVLQMDWKGGCEGRETRSEAVTV